MKPAKFITFEGGEGSGKSTQAERLAAKLRDQGADVVLTREPGGSPFAERLRAVLLDPETPAHDALAEALIFYAARADHLTRTIRPALDAGRWVICDRFSDSTRVYQSVAGGLDSDICDRLDAIVVRETQPDLTFVLDVSATVGLARAQARRATRGAPVIAAAAADESISIQDPQADRYEGRDLAFHETLRRGFLDLVMRDSGRCRLIDGEQNTDAIAKEIWDTLSAELCPAALR